MKATFALVLVLAFPLVGFADALATSVCVLEKGQFDKLVKTAGDITKVATGDLWAASLKTDFLDKTAEKPVGLEFTHGGKQFRVHVTEVEGKILYAILNITEKAGERLVAAGEIAKGKEVKESTAGEPFVVVARIGNFLTK